eukprot:CAMPEP_0170742552 /NCGR_PEP_ID=MMETSP0437-20130122/6804_1 /TAXON_ID=0 /ORGANISM="Sexangularia sp." /LENGTH=1011 /DNA_ID=CAMNT_0011081179 /DNA_START=1 /DNA_END=3033 /DNA_ORIENTATION=-
MREKGTDFYFRLRGDDLARFSDEDDDVHSKRAKLSSSVTATASPTPDGTAITLSCDQWPKDWKVLVPQAPVAQMWLRGFATAGVKVVRADKETKAAPSPKAAPPPTAEPTADAIVSQLIVDESAYEESRVPGWLRDGDTIAVKPSPPTMAVSANLALLIELSNVSSKEHQLSLTLAEVESGRRLRANQSWKVVSQRVEPSDNPATRRIHLTISLLEPELVGHTIILTGKVKASPEPPNTLAVAVIEESEVPRPGPAVIEEARLFLAANHSRVGASGDWVLYHPSDSEDSAWTIAVGASDETSVRLGSTVPVEVVAGPGNVKLSLILWLRQGTASWSKLKANRHWKLAKQTSSTVGDKTRLVLQIQLLKVVETLLDDSVQSAEVRVSAAAPNTEEARRCNVSFAIVREGAAPDGTAPGAADNEDDDAADDSDPISDELPPLPPPMPDGLDDDAMSSESRAEGGEGVSPRINDELPPPPLLPPSVDNADEPPAYVVENLSSDADDSERGSQSNDGDSAGADGATPSPGARAASLLATPTSSEGGGMARSVTTISSSSTTGRSMAKSKSTTGAASRAKAKAARRRAREEKLRAEFAVPPVPTKLRETLGVPEAGFPPGTSMTLVFATFDFAGTAEGHLTLQEGDGVAVLDEVNGWMWGYRVDGECGRFPGNFVTKVGSCVVPAVSMAPLQLGGANDELDDDWSSEEEWSSEDEREQVAREDAEAERRRRDAEAGGSFDRMYQQVTGVTTARIVQRQLANERRAAAAGERGKGDVIGQSAYGSVEGDEDAGDRLSSSIAAMDEAARNRAKVSKQAEAAIKAASGGMGGRQKSMARAAAARNAAVGGDEEMRRYKEEAARVKAARLRGEDVASLIGESTTRAVISEERRREMAERESADREAAAAATRKAAETAAARANQAAAAAVAPGASGSRLGDGSKGRGEAAAHVVGPTGLPLGWKEATDPSGKTYYFVPASGEVSWTRPTGRPTFKLPSGWSSAHTSDGQLYFYNGSSTSW